MAAVQGLYVEIDFKFKNESLMQGINNAKKALKNGDMPRLRLSVSVIKNVCVKVLERIDQEFPLDKSE